MNTIKLYLKSSGSVAELDYDFRIYKGSYNNIDVEIYVPSSILSSVDASHPAGVKTAMVITDPNGRKKTTIGYNAEQVGVDPVEVAGVEYYVYKQSLPRVFVSESGEQELVANVFLIDATGDDPIISQVITSQMAQIMIQESDYVGDDIVDPSAIELLTAELNNKQDKIDNDIAITGTLADAEHKVVKSINALNTQVTENTSSISSLNDSVDSLDGRVDNLEASITGQENPIGKMSVANTLPTDEQLNAFVYAHTDPAREPEINDVIIVDLQINSVVETYKYIYTTNGWVYYQISEQNPAGNEVYGLVEGTYGIADYNQPINASIVNGQIVNVYYKDNADGYYSVATRLNANKENIANIISGTQQVGNSAKATNDGENNNIVNTYAKKSDVYTKSESDIRYLPATYSNIYYYSADGLVEEIPESPASGVQFSANVPQAGEVELAICGREVEGNYHFTKNSTDASSIWLMTDADCVLTFRMLTYAVNEENEYLLSSVLSNEIVFTAGVPKLVEFPTTYSALSNTAVDINAGDTFRKEIYVTSADAVATEVDLISSIQYTSTFNLVAQSIIFDVNTINGIGEVNILASDWVLQDNNEYQVYIPQTRHQQAPTSQYLLALQQFVGGEYQYISFTPSVDVDGNITITNYDAINCRLLIASATSKETKGIIEITNPASIPQIDYETAGALKITQTTEQSATLTLPNPTDVGKFYSFMVANSSESDYAIVVNGETIEIGKGIQFKWVGSWITGEEPTDTTEVYDSAKSQTLALTLSGIEGDVSGLDTAINGVGGISSRLSTAESNITGLGTSKQDATDNNLATTDKTIVGAINELNSGKQAVLSEAQTDAVNSGIDATKVGQIATNTNNISTNADNISALTGRMTTAEGNITTLQSEVKDCSYSAKRSENFVNITPNTAVNVAFRTQLYANDLFVVNDQFTQVTPAVAHDYTIKVVAGFGSATASGSGDIVLSIYNGTTLLASTTKTYGNGDDLGQVVVGKYVENATPDIIVKIEHTFSGNITMDEESGISIQRVDGSNKVSASDNAFDIEFGTRWAKDYANKTITLK